MAGNSLQLSPKQFHLASAGLSQLPPEWGIVEIQELLSSDRGISVGVMYPGDHDPKGIPLIRAGDLSGNIINSNPELCITSEKHKEYSRTEFSGNEILMTLVGDVGQCAVVPETMAGWNAARAIAVIRLTEHSDAQYVRLCLMSRPIRHLMTVWSNTTVQATLNLKEVKRLPIPWPPKIVRDRIAQIASSIDDKIELNRRMNQTLEAMAQAIFKSWFVDFEPVKAKQQARVAGESVQMAAMMALSGKSATEIEQLSSAQRASLAETAVLFPERLVESELGLIPEGWEASTFQEIAAIIMGQSPKGDTYNDNGEGVPLVNGPVEFGTYFAEKSKWTTTPTKLALPGDLIVCVRGSTTGRFVISDDAYCLGRGVCAIRGKNSQAFASYTFKHHKKRLLEMATGSTFPSWSSKTLKEFRVINPKSDLLNRFDSCVHSLTEKADKNVHMSAILMQLRDTLLPKLLSGELNIPDTMAQIEEVLA